MTERQVGAYGGTIFSGRVKPGTELVYTIGVRSVDSFPMVLGESV